MKFKFLRTYSDLTTHPEPGLIVIDADSLNEAIQKVCETHRLRILEQQENSIWLEDDNGVNVKYLFEH